MLMVLKKAFYYKAGVHWLSCAGGQRVAGTWFRLGGEFTSRAQRAGYAKRQVDALGRKFAKLLVG